MKVKNSFKSSVDYINLLKNDFSNFKILPDHLKSDRTFIQQALKINGEFLFYLSD
jgi:hypothetical protein